MKIFVKKLLNNKFRFIGISLFWLLAVLPLLLGLGYALLYSLGITGIMSKGFIGQYWTAMLQNPELWHSLGFSIYIATVSMTIALVLALAGTLFFHRFIRKGFFSYVIYLPLAIPSIVAGLFVFQMLSKAGFLSRLAWHWGLTESIQTFPDLINDAWGIGIILAHVMLAVPFLMIYFQNIYCSENLDELSRLATSLGSTRFACMLKVQMPIILMRALPTLLLYYIFVLGSYEIPLLLGRESPQMISVLVVRKLRRFNLMNIPEAYVVALVYIALVLPFVIYLFHKKNLSYDL